MTLKPLTGKAEIRAAYNNLVKTFQNGAQKVRKRVGWKGESRELDVYWRPVERIWSVFEPAVTGNRYWCCFGVSDPTEAGTLSITCEINSPYEGINLRTAGMFVSDDHGTIFVGHSGKIGGGRKGVGKRAFLDWIHGEGLGEVLLPDGYKTIRIIGRVDAPHLPAHIAEFARDVDRFKSLITGSKSPMSQMPVEFIFTPEFSGNRKPYEVSGLIEANCDHGVVIAALVSELRSIGFELGNSRPCDVFLCDDARQMTYLFEIKTNLDTQSLYCAVGQLMLHGAQQRIPPHRILVIPDEPRAQTCRALCCLGIAIVTYEWVDNRPRFFGLTEAIE